jgi:alanine racemase
VTGSTSTPVPSRSAIVDLDALRHNIAVLIARSAGGPLVLDVTADAYGHGLLPVATVAAEAGVDILSLRDEADARRIAEAGITIDVHAWHTGRAAMPPAGAGIAAFGYGMRVTDGDPDGLVPVMTLTAPVCSVKRVAEGHGVSYGFVYRTSTESTLALVPLGYADGIPRVATGSARMALRGAQHPVVGRIAMDQVVLDVGDSPVSLGDTVTVFGPGAAGEPSAADWAQIAGTTAGEILARIGQRVPRCYVDSRGAR